MHCHDTRKNPEGKQNILDGETGDVSCDFYHHYEEDIQRMKNMGLKAFRFPSAGPEYCQTVRDG